MRKILFLFSLLILISTTKLFSQLYGTFTVGSGGDYPTIAAAVADLNYYGVADPGVTFNVLAGHTENTTAPITITATGTASAPIVFQKSGSGANPLITRTDAGSLATSVIGGAGDAIIRLEGTDYITFDGIDVTANDQGIEYGYLTHKPSGTDGCQNVTIKNCTITMNKGTSGYVVGIYIGNGTTSVSSADGVTVTANSGKNQNITIIGNTITDVHAGIIVRGSSATGYYDSDITIGQSGAGNTITNFGGGNASTTYGIYFIYVNNPTVAYNTITSATHGYTLFGISYFIVTGNVVGSNNAITLANNSTSSYTYFIYNDNDVTSEDYSNNTFAAGILSSTGNVYLIYTSNNTPDKTISGNSISGTINRTGSSGKFYCYYNFGSPTSGTETIQNNNFSNITLSGSSSFYGIYTYTATGQNRVCSGNTVSNITSGTGYTYLIYVLSTTSNQVYNNTIQGITAGGTVYGLYFTGTNPTVYGNNVYNITTSSTTIYGIYDGGTGTTNCYKNQVYNLTCNNSSATLYGIYITAGTSNYVYNNFVSDLKTPSSGSTTGLVGIYVSGGTTVGLYYNTVYLNASSTGTNFGSSAIYASTTPTVDLRNNIFVNVSTPNGTGLTVAYRRSSTTLTSYSNNSNYNDFYAGTPSSTNLIFYDGTNSDQTIAAYKTRVAPRDAASFTENPPFVNVSTTPYNLHLQTNVATQCESGGGRITSPIAITNDFDGDTRWGETGYSGSGTAVDVGADEFEGIPLDLTPPEITYTALSNTTSTSNRVLTNFATITDPSGVNTTDFKPRIYFKKSTDNNTYVDNTSSTNGWKYAEASNASSPFSFTIDYSIIYGGSVSTGDVIQYFVVAQDLATTPNVGINSGTFASTPSSVNLTADAFPIGGTINSYNIVQGLSGNVTVGSGGTYSTLTGDGGLFADINSKVLTGDITATIISDLSESGTNALNQMATEGGNWTLTIQPDAATVRNITGSYAGGLIRLNGADRVTIDGRYSGSGNYLNFVNSATSGTIAPLQIISLGTGQGAENITIRNCTFSNGYIGTSTYGIFAGSATLGTAQGDNDNLTIRDNVVKKSYRGIYVAGVSGAVNDNLNILNNEVGSDVSSDYVYKYGIYVAYANNADISGNHIFNMSSTTATPVGLSVETGVTNTTISKNRIHNIAYTGSSGFGGRGMYVNTGSSSSNLTIHNNVICDIKGDGWSNFSNSSMVGIYIDGTTGGLNIYYNSVNLYGTFSRNTATKTAAMLFNNSGITNVDLRNNIFVNSMDNTTVTTDKNYAIYSSTAASNFTAINYNDYYASGAQGVLGYIGNSDKTTLEDWRSASGQDSNSVSKNVTFVDSTDLHLSASHAGDYDLRATPITSITTDIDNDTRNNTYPYKGADELNVPAPVQLSSFTASTKGRDVILNWTTATEVNTAGFEIERKLVSQEKAQAKWENVGFVRGNGNSNRPVEYTFTDMKLNTGKYAYRLKMVDNDGSYEYSNEVVVEIGKPDVTKIEQNYPNAFNPATKIEYQLANPSKVVIEVYNITGQKITELVNDEQVEGYYSLVFDASKYGLASGIYFYRMIAMDRVTGKNVFMTKKMLYLK